MFDNNGGQKMNAKLLFRLPLPPLARYAEPCPWLIDVFEDRVEIEYFKPRSTKLCRKKFDFRDLYLMNETLNIIMRPQNERKSKD